jgi:uncharacterized repeat protein (TIGR01451 family)
VQVGKNWAIGGLDQEDTILHFDTLNGETHVVPSNRVCIYAPRFAAVRKVYGIMEHDYHQGSAGVAQDMRMERFDDVNQATTVVQPVQPVRDIGIKTAVTFEEQQRLLNVDNTEIPRVSEASLMPFEDFTIIRIGQYDASEKVRLAERVMAAEAWSHAQAVQVIENGVPASEAVNVSSASETRFYDLQGKGRMRICKVASKQNALPGETVEFTLRFDNMGDQLVGNVTIVDNLTTRLEYVDGSQECTLKADFRVEENAGESLILRWEITDPIPVGKGGVIRFQCRVR